MKSVAENSIPFNEKFPLALSLQMEVCIQVPPRKQQQQQHQQQYQQKLFSACNRERESFTCSKQNFSIKLSVRVLMSENSSRFLGVVLAERREKSSDVCHRAEKLILAEQQLRRSPALLSARRKCAICYQ